MWDFSCVGEARPTGARERWSGLGGLIELLLVLRARVAALISVCYPQYANIQARTPAENMHREYKAWGVYGQVGDNTPDYQIDPKVLKQPHS